MGGGGGGVLNDIFCVWLLKLGTYQVCDIGLDPNNFSKEYFSCF
jgi:hypothetical protein